MNHPRTQEETWRSRSIEHPERRGEPGAITGERWPRLRRASARIATRRSGRTVPARTVGTTTGWKSSRTPRTRARPSSHYRRRVSANDSVRVGLLRTLDRGLRPFFLDLRQRFEPFLFDLDIRRGRRAGRIREGLLPAFSFDQPKGKGLAELSDEASDKDDQHPLENIPHRFEVHVRMVEEGVAADKRAACG